MGRHSRKGPAPQGARNRGGQAPGAPVADPPAAGPDGPGGGRRRRSDGGLGPEQHRGAPDSAAGPGGPRVRGGHPEQREPGGGWGSAQRYGDPQGYGDKQRHGDRPGAALPSGRTRSGAGTASRVPGPRREFVDAFDGFDAFDTTGSLRTVSGAGTAPGFGPAPCDLDGPPGPGGPAADTARPARGGKGRALTGIAAAAVTTVLAVVVAGQVADGGAREVSAKASGGTDRGTDDDIASRSEGRAVPPLETAPPRPVVAAPLTYDQLMTRQFPLDPKLTASGDFDAVPGLDKAPGKGQKFRYRVDVEKGLGLDGTLFAQAVQKTLNDNRSWAHNGAMTFERISSGAPDFVITLASPGTTAFWCAKSGLDTTVDNVSCDSASTDRVMINAFRWARGSQTYGDRAMFAYRQMLINHEIGHRLGHSHVSCRTPGTLAPVMQQQTKSLNVEGIKCKPNPWVYPTD
ncbi:DUF3152 domain-containing protein [Streptomyces liangshanensis]|uniref:DUF3152 domain-containing protein n=1 Tax=Streptomyces liangshanensis TaxID=2717324 RepID=A0A6G9GX18_9ACTN|nr:DUF3152 domain-containing protein [Streptomyces liangshanensis]QIQ02808.1 DUF3152 domain-containing protein [Streptomyces liangshanensis]